MYSRSLYCLQTQLAPVSRQATGSLRQEAIVSQKPFCEILWLFLLDFMAYNPGLNYEGATISERFRKGVGGRGLATNKPPKRAQKVLQKWVRLLLRGHREKGTEKRPESLAYEGLLVPTPQKPKTCCNNSSFAILSFTLGLYCQVGTRVATGFCDPVSRRASRQHLPTTFVDLALERL